MNIPTGAARDRAFTAGPHKIGTSRKRQKRRIYHECDGGIEKSVSRIIGKKMKKASIIS